MSERTDKMWRERVATLQVVPDDYCEACRKQVANRECGHGILCDVCDEQVHGSVNGECEVTNG